MLLSLSGVILQNIADQTPYKMTISSSTYEVHFKYDNVYYTHCYHQAVKQYDSAERITDSYTDYYQSVGG